MKAFRFLPDAGVEAGLAARHCEEASAGLGVVFRGFLQQAIDAVREHPELGREVGLGLRRILVRRFPYSVIYGVEGDAIVITAVAHHRRRPGYWR